LVVLSPYLMRNAVATGNPVFPFAIGVFGGGHWDATLVERWDRAHGLSDAGEAGEAGEAGGAGIARAAWRQWLGNAGYGAVGGGPTPVERDNVARFAVEGGVPVLWLAAAGGALMMLIDRRSRGVAGLCIVWLAWMLAFWAVATHLQSRFLVTTLLPGVLLIGVGLSVAIARLPTARRSMGLAIAGVLLVLPIYLSAWSILQRQTPPARDEHDRLTLDRAGRPVGWPVAAVIDAWPLDAHGTAPLHPINALPPDTRTLVVADNHRLLYVARPIAYATPFDPNPLGRAIRHHGPDPRTVTAALQDAGFTHIYVGWSELDRLHRTYGYDPDVTPDALHRLIATGWRPVAPQLYALPTASAASSASPISSRPRGEGVGPP
jgi:hypothetical protein